MFAVPEQLQGQEEKEGGGAGAQRSPTTEYETHFGEAEEGSQTALNRELGSKALESATDNRNLKLIRPRCGPS